MKKIIRLFPLFFCMALPVIHAQVKPGAKDSTARKVVAQDTSWAKEKKNELAFNIVPVVQFLTGAYTGGNVQRFSFFYRRRMTSTGTLRIGFMFDKIKTSYYNQKDSAYTVVSQTDSSQFRKFDRGNLVYIKPALLVGYEAEHGKKKLKRFYGADLAVGVFHFYNKQYYHTYISDPTNQNNPWQPSSAPDILIQRQDYNVFFFGLMPFYGMRYHFTDHLILSAQVGLNIFADVGGLTTENATNQKVTTPYHKLDTASPGLVNDISLIFRF